MAPAEFLSIEGGPPFEDSITPVSYTHLDVYKRQVYNRVTLKIMNLTFLSLQIGKNNSKYKMKNTNIYG